MDIIVWKSLGMATIMGIIATIHYLLVEKWSRYTHKIFLILASLFLFIYHILIYGLCYLILLGIYRDIILEMDITNSELLFYKILLIVIGILGTIKIYIVINNEWLGIMTTKLEERLNRIIEEKEDKIENLQEQVEQLENERDLQNFLWQKQTYFQENELQKTLPVPRLEMRFKRVKTFKNDNGWYNVEWVYGIVYKHYAETHSETMLFIPFSKTTGSGGGGTFEHYFRNGKLDTPFRDGVHIVAESKVFGLPAYIICEEKGIIQEIDLNMDMDEQLSKMIRKIDK